MSQTVGCKYWAATTITAALQGPAMKAPYNGRLSGDFSWTGTPTGTIALESRIAGGTWGTVPDSSAEFTTQPAGAAQAAPIKCNWYNLPGDEFRFTYTGTANGTITANIAFGDVQEG